MWGSLTGQFLQPKDPENGGQKAVDAVETQASAAQVAWMVVGGLLGTLGTFRHFGHSVQNRIYIA